MNLNTSKIQAREEKKGLKKTQKKVFNVRSKAFFIELLGIGWAGKGKYFKEHTSRKLFFTKTFSPSTFPLNVSHLELKWRLFFNLFKELTRLRLKSIVFTTKHAMEEAMFLNWELLQPSFRFFKKILPHYFF
jgi:hypothetical protein